MAEIVGYAEKAGLVAIVNTHHDETYWLDIAKAYNNAAQNEKVKDAIFSVWTQIANRFKEKGEWLVFESFNEIQDGGWGWSAAFQANPQAQYKVLNEWNQTFVDAVRSTGGNNATRWLGVPGYAANPGFTITGLVLPTDYTSENRLMVAVHDYDPYNYTLNNPLVRQWGHTADKDKRCSDYDEEGVVAVFDNLKKAYRLYPQCPFPRRFRHFLRRARPDDGHPVQPEQEQFHGRPVLHGLATAQTNGGGTMKRWRPLLLAAVLLAACSGKTTLMDELPDIYPDYIGVTIPAGIAPLNFNLPEEYTRVYVRVSGSLGGNLLFSRAERSFRLIQQQRSLAQPVEVRLREQHFRRPFADGRLRFHLGRQRPGLLLRPYQLQLR